METGLIVIGMIAAFFAGAYVRKPFGPRVKERREEIARGETAEKDRQAEQLNNLMNYNGSRQYPEDE